MRKRMLAIGLIGPAAIALTLFIAAAPTTQAAPPSSLRSFGVSGLTSSAAGTAQTVKVTALTNGKANSAYRGTVVLTSTDTKAALPAPYTFTAADKGVHSLPVTLKTSGSQSVTATESGAIAVTGSQTATVSPGPASTFALSDPTAVTAGAAQSVTLTVRDAFNNVATGYRGTVHLTSSDPQAVLPANYPFTAGDAGSHAFSVTLKTAGAQTVTLTDTAAATRTATSTPATVSAASASSLALTGLANAAAGATQSVLVTVHDQYGNVAKGYTGTVAFGSSDPAADLPSNHTFTAADAGARSFNVALKTAGQQSVNATDQSNAALSSSHTVAIGGGPAVALDMSTDLTGTFNGTPVATAGAAFKVFLTAVDAYGNTATGYTGTVRLTSSDGRTSVPGGGSGVQFIAGDAGTKTLLGTAFFTKAIYQDHASLTAADTVNGRIATGMTFEVLPGPAVRYSTCEHALSKSSGYQDVNAPIGVNDELGLPFTALDAYGNDATNREPLIVLGSTLPHGYEATADVTTSDPQAANITGATFTGSPIFVGPPVDITLRTAGVQTVTITDPDNASLTRTCSYTVLGPKAFTGTVSVADPKTTGNTTMSLPASSYLPPNDPGTTIDTLSAPFFSDPITGPTQLGTVEPLVLADMPFVTWDLNPALPPPGARTCGTLAPCVTGAPVRIAYTVRDNYGNSSPGIITVEPFNAQVPSGGITYASSNVILIDGAAITLGNPIAGRVIGTQPGSATIQVGADAAVNVATGSTGGGLVVGDPVTTVIQRPLVVGGNTPDCTPDPAAGTVCEKAGFVAVTIVPGVTGDTSSPPPTKAVLSTVAYDSCGLISGGGDSACPRISFNFFEPPSGEGTPPPGFVGVPYVSCKVFVAPDITCKPFQFEAFSSLVPEEGVTFQMSGISPPGLHLSADGILSGTPSSEGLFTFEVRATGVRSGATRDYLVTQAIFHP